MLEDQAHGRLQGDGLRHRSGIAPDIAADDDNPAESPQAKVGFLKRCARWIPVINFTDYENGGIYARLQRGKWVWRDEARFDKALDDPEVSAGQLAVAHDFHGSVFGAEQKDTAVATEKMHTLGTWGAAAPSG